MKLLSLGSLLLVTLVLSVRETAARSLRSPRRASQVQQQSATSVDNAKVNGTRPRGVFLFDDNCLWYVHGKGQLVAKINCITSKKHPPVIVAQRRNGKMHYKLQHSRKPFGMSQRKTSRGKRRKIPLKCYYRYDKKGVFYLTSCYTHSSRFGPVEMNFHGHRPGDKKHHHKARAGKRRRKHRGGKRSKKGGRRRRGGRRSHIAKLNRMLKKSRQQRDRMLRKMREFYEWKKQQRSNKKKKKKHSKRRRKQKAKRKDSFDSVDKKRTPKTGDSVV